MSSEHVVVPIEDLEWLVGIAMIHAPIEDTDRAASLLDQAVPVERMKFTVQGQVVDISTVWVES